jgi:gamma-glutamyltranspeptidase / glutathione hydrolase
MISLIQATNGTMTLADLKAYNITTKPPLSITYRSHKLSAVGAPASGAVCLSTLKTMEQYPASDWFADEGLSTHRFDEAMRFAYGARMELGDPVFVEQVPALQKLMLDEDAAKGIRGRILDNSTLPVEKYDPMLVYSAEGHGTSHVVTADRNGMATSLTTTINLLFGAQIMVPDSGIILYVFHPQPLLHSHHRRSYRSSLLLLCWPLIL